MSVAPAGPGIIERWLGRKVANNPGIVRRLANLENRFFRAELDAIEIDRPIYISGLARAGTTIVLEALARHSDVASHRYRDFPLAAAPLLWNRFLDQVPRRSTGPVERAHGDGIRITPDSPEAMEEMTWMAFFPHIHDPRQPAVIDGGVRHPDFETAYRDHIRKILLLRKGRRYLAKANYNLTRLGLLTCLFPSTRLVLLIRNPVSHVDSLLRQHRRFCERGRREPWVVDHMRQAGHFEFGLDRRPINCGTTAATANIDQLWTEGHEVLGWARYWAMIYDFVARLLAQCDDVRQASLVVRHEELREHPSDALKSIHAHCGLSIDDQQLRRIADMISSPAPVQTELSLSERALVERETAAVAAQFGYGGDLLRRAL